MIFVYGYIYETTCLLNNVKYIGKKKSDIFLGNKYLGSGIALNNAIKRYGKQNFSVKLLKICNSLQELNYFEKLYIKNYKNKFILYNISEGGDGGKTTKQGAHFNHKHSEETKKKISEKLKGRHLLDETKRKLSEHAKHRTHSEETKQKISAKMKQVRLGIKPSEETKRKISNTLKGRKHSEETKRKISQKLKQRYKI